MSCRSPRDALVILEDVYPALGITETVLGGESLAGVAHDGDDEHAVFGLERAQADLDRELRAVGPSPHERDARSHRTRARVGAVPRAVGAVYLAEPGRQQFLDESTEQLVAPVAEEHLGLAVHHQDRAVLVRADDAVRRRLDERPRDVVAQFEPGARPRVAKPLGGRSRAPIGLVFHHALPERGSSRAANTAACVRRSIPSFERRLET